MSKRQVLIILGVWIMVFLFLGFPPEWDKIFALVVGLLVIIIAIQFRPAGKPVAPDRIPYVEHRLSKPTESSPVSTDTISSTDSTAS